MRKRRPAELRVRSLWAAPPGDPPAFLAADRLHLVLLEGTTSDSLLARLDALGAARLSWPRRLVLRVQETVADLGVMAAILVVLGLFVLSLPGVFLDRFLVTFDPSRPVDWRWLSLAALFVVSMVLLFRLVPSLVRGETDDLLQFLERLVDPTRSRRWRRRFVIRLAPLTDLPVSVWLFDEALLEERWLRSGLLPALARAAGSGVEVVVSAAARREADAALSPAGFAVSAAAPREGRGGPVSAACLGAAERWLVVAFDATASHRRLTDDDTGLDGRVACEEVVELFLERIERDGVPPEVGRRGGAGRDAVYDRLRGDLRVLGRGRESSERERTLLLLDPPAGFLPPEMAHRREATVRHLRESRDLLRHVSRPLAARLVLEMRTPAAIATLGERGRVDEAFLTALEHFIHVCAGSYAYSTFELGWREVVQRFEGVRPFSAEVDLSEELPVPLLFRLLGPRALREVASLLARSNDGAAAAHAFDCLESVRPIIGIAHRAEVQRDRGRGTIHLHRLIDLRRQVGAEEAPLAHLHLSIVVAWEVVVSERDGLLDECREALDAAELLMRGSVDEIDPDLAFMFYNARGHFLTWTEQWQQALEAYRRALLVPGEGRLRESSIFVNMGITYRRWAQSTGDLERMRRAVELNRAGVEIKRAMREKGQFVYAAHNLVETLLRYGCRCGDAKHFREARELAVEAIETALESKNRADHPRLGHLLVEHHLACRALCAAAGEPPSGRTDLLDRLLAWLPDDGEVHDNRRLLLELSSEVTGQRVESFAHLRALVEQPDGPATAMGGA